MDTRNPRGAKHCGVLIAAIYFCGILYTNCFAQFSSASDKCEQTQGFMSTVSVTGAYSLPAQSDDVRFIVKAPGQILVNTTNTRLTNAKIDCQGLGTQDGLTVLAVDGLYLRNVCIRNCGGVGLNIQGGSGHDIARVDIRGTGQEALVLDGVANSTVIGLTTGLGISTKKGVVVKNGSHDNRLVSALFVKPKQGSSLTLDASATHNQIVRTRFTGNGSSLSCGASDNNLWLDNLCPGNIVISGSCLCGQGYSVGSDPVTSYTPRSWTVCLKNTTYRPQGQPSHCIHTNVNNVLTDSEYSPADLIVADTHPGSPPEWPALMFDNTAGPVSLVGNTISQNGLFTFRVDFASLTPANNGPLQENGTRLQNFFYADPEAQLTLPPVQGEHIHLCFHEDAVDICEDTFSP